MTEAGGAWTVEHHHGSAAFLHRLDDPVRARRVVRIFEVDSPALVLGSAQPADLVDLDRADAAGVAIVRRRSGGGLVFVATGRQVWADLLVPRDDRLWDDDVVRAAAWVGRLWATVIGSFTTEPVTVHGGGMVADCWGRLLCFAGTGPAEVFVAGRKIVGVSQRRSRSWIRVQSMTPLRAAPGLDAVELLALSEVERAEARSVTAARATGLRTGADAVVESLLANLPH